MRPEAAAERVFARSVAAGAAGGCALLAQALCALRPALTGGAPPPVDPVVATVGLAVGGALATHGAASRLYARAVVRAVGDAVAAAASPVVHHAAALPAAGGGGASPAAMAAATKLADRAAVKTQVATLLVSATAAWGATAGYGGEPVLAWITEPAVDPYSPDYVADFAAHKPPVLLRMARSVALLPVYVVVGCAVAAPVVVPCAVWGARRGVVRVERMLRRAQHAA